MNKKTYDVLKFIAQIALPAFITLWVTISTIWGIPYKDAIAGTLAAIDAFLGALLMLDSNKYFKDKVILDAIDFEDGNEKEE